MGASFPLLGAAEMLRPVGCSGISLCYLWPGCLLERPGGEGRGCWVKRTGRPPPSLLGAALRSMIYGQ